MEINAELIKKTSDEDFIGSRSCSWVRPVRSMSGLIVDHYREENDGVSKFGDDTVPAALEFDPAHVLSPGVAIEDAEWIDGHTAVGGIEIDPADIGAPGVAGKPAVGCAVDAVVIGGGVQVGVCASPPRVSPGGSSRYSRPRRCLPGGPYRQSPRSSES